jgi:hypothetical protein
MLSAVDVIAIFIAVAAHATHRVILIFIIVGRRR